jgi:hypothetical protein
MAPPNMETAALAGRRKLPKRVRQPKPYTQKPSPAKGDLIDRYGHLHSEAVLRNWHPTVIKSLGIRRIDGGDL